MTEALVIFSILFFILGVVFIYPLFFSKRNTESQSNLQFVYHRSTYRPQLSKVLKLIFALIIPAMFHVMVASSSSLEFSKETYAFLVAVATILLFLI
ncbi:MAG: hypothetical protein BM556_09185 [Bacteriovorax sp. MedPE-SWde]|nr:MAG: hypothetical protein BM556_09185 [Bacteriovorax sp. MedPE-SWde]